MAAGENGRLQVARTRRERSGWLQLVFVLAVAAAIGLVAHLAGLPDRLTPLVIGGCLALLTALVTGSPRTHDDD